MACPVGRASAQIGAGDTCVTLAPAAGSEAGHSLLFACAAPSGGAFGANALDPSGAAWEMFFGVLGLVDSPSGALLDCQFSRVGTLPSWDGASTTWNSTAPGVPGARDGLTIEVTVDGAPPATATVEYPPDDSACANPPSPT